MATNKKGSQRNVYLSTEEWEKHDKIVEDEGLKGETSAMVSIFRKFLRGNLVFKRNK